MAVVRNAVNTTTAARLAVLTPYWDFWEHTVGPALRAERYCLSAPSRYCLSSATPSAADPFNA